MLLKMILLQCGVSYCAIMAVMDLKNLQLFQHLASSLHFGQTANAMFVSPSTLSRAIQRLEDECGAALFVRDNRSVQLTAVGKKMLMFANQTLTDWHQLTVEIDQQNQELHGELSLFCSVTASFTHLPQLLQDFGSLYPQVDIKLTTGDPALSVTRVLQKEVDVAIAVKTPDFPKQLYFSRLDVVPLVMIVPATSNITQLTHVDWRNNSMILPESGPSKRIVHHWLAEQGVKPKVYATVAGHEAIVSMVALGCGIGIVPRIVVENTYSANKVNIIPLVNIESFELGLCCLAKRSGEAIVKALIERIE